MSTGVAMLMKSMGIDPQAMQQQIGAVVGAAQNADARIAVLQQNMQELHNKVDAIYLMLMKTPARSVNLSGIYPMQAISNGD